MAKVENIAWLAMDQKVLVLVEEHYDETEYNVFNDFFPKKGITVEYGHKVLNPMGLPIFK